MAAPTMFIKIASTATSTTPVRKRLKARRFLAKDILANAAYPSTPKNAVTLAKYKRSRKSSTPRVMLLKCPSVDTLVKIALNHPGNSAVTTSKPIMVSTSKMANDKIKLTT